MIHSNPESRPVHDQQLLTSAEALTLIRHRGLFHVQSDQIASNENPFGAYGICIVSDQALAIGVTAVPTPYTDADSDLWIVHGYWGAPVKVATAVGFNDISQRYPFDSKAMRKLSPDETMILVVENGEASGGIQYIFLCATLLKLG
jgi:hypothetical protein